MRSPLMNTPYSNTPDPLFEVERKIARRADELDRKFGVNLGSALDHWRQAEQEIWRSQQHPTAGVEALVR
jgi:hypothetical protein